MSDDSRFNPYQAPTADTDNVDTSPDGRPAIYANYGWRLLAHLIDGSVCWLMLMLVGFVGSQTSLQGPNVLYAVFAVILGLPWAYYVFQESSSMQGTIGKKWLGLAVTDLAGNRISTGRATIRFAGKFFAVTLMFLATRIVVQPGLPVILLLAFLLIPQTLFLIDYLTPLFNRKHQAIHDMIAGCLVIKMPSGNHTYKQWQQATS